MIIFITANGLGNRLRTIGSLQNVARKTGHKLFVVWSKEFDLNADFSDFFEPTEDFLVLNIKINKWTRNFLSHYFLYPRITKLLRALIVSASYIQSHSEIEMIDDFQKNKLILIRTCYEFTKQYNLDSFRFNNQVKQQSVIEKNKICRENLIGIHIRRGDHAISSEYSSSELFEAYIKDVERKNQGKTFYIASDSVDEKEKLKCKYGTSVITQPVSSYDRGTKEGMIESAIELYNLSCCCLVVGSFTSTFSEMASRLGHSKLEILFDKKRKPIDDWDYARDRRTAMKLNRKEWIRYYFDYILVVLGYKRYNV